ncbi:MAG: M14 family zinc carboxypeptidase [Pseudobdellovibrionaceae bacterium]
MQTKFFGSLLAVLLSACISKSGAATPSNLNSTEAAAAPATEATPAPAPTQAAAPAPPPALEKKAAPETSSKPTQVKADLLQMPEVCEKSLSRFTGKFDSKVLKAACEKVEILQGCQSVQGTPIFHFNKTGEFKKPSRILVFSLIHGDEFPAGSVGRFWMERLETIVPRNTWRVVPVLNPDGVIKKTRTNANKVDINRNFPTQDWTEKAQAYWQKDSKSNPRRFPGNLAASEPETQCALKHIEDFKPDFIVSIHTPLKVLDYDGPKVKPPKFDYLPWKSLGHYPGSLGRYMWFERQIPVLTMELKEDLPASNKPWLQLQDIIGVLVGLESMNKKPASNEAP